MARKQNRRKFLRNLHYQKREMFGCFLLVLGGGLILQMLFKQLPAANWLLSFLGGVLIVVALFLLSQRIIGPMIRFESTLEAMQQGHLHKTIQLRKKDEGIQLAQKINDFNGQLSQSFRIIGQNSKALHILIDQLAALDLPEQEKEQLASICWSMQEHNRRISYSCNYFNGKDH